MLLLQDFPYELTTQIISNLNGKDISQFIRCDSSIYDRSRQDSFWLDLCKLKGVSYRHPDISWKELFCSGDLPNMCPHLRTSMMSVTRQKKELLWSSINMNNDGILCLTTGCDFLGDAPCYLDNHAAFKHNIILKVSPRHTLEVWCNSCQKAIGFDGFATNVSQGVKCEKFIMTQTLKAITSIYDDSTDDLLALQIIKGRQEIESNIFKYQFRQSTMHVIEKGWYTAWIDFISGKSTDVPGSLANDRLFQSDGSLDPTLSLSKDFELIGSLARWYIERIYGVVGSIISSTDLYQNPEYCKLIHSIRIRQQMNSVSRYPPIFAASN